MKLKLKILPIFQGDFFFLNEEVDDFMVLTTPGIPGKLLEFWNVLSGPWKTPRITNDYFKLLENSWNFEIFFQGLENSWKTDHFPVLLAKLLEFCGKFFICKPEPAEALDSWLYFSYLCRLNFSCSYLAEITWYRFVFAKRKFEVGSWKIIYLPWRTPGILLSSFRKQHVISFNFSQALVAYFVAKPPPG